MATHETVTALLRARAAEQPERLGYSFLADGDTEELRLTYGEADRRARAIAASLHAEGVRAGDRALLVLPPGLDYLTALFGALYAGAVAVPVYPPDPFHLDRSLSRLRAIVRDAEPAVAVTTSALLSLLDEVTGLAPELEALRWAAADIAVDPGSEPAEAAPAATALLQYTSGATADPRGVLLSHANLLHNSWLIQRLFATTAESRGVIWLPPYHDMGLIGGVLQPLYVGFPVTLMSPMHFMEDPVRWLRAIERAGATASGGPNFAYDLCARKCAPEEAARLDLSSWRVAFNGAEPIRPATLERFASAFAPSGFQPDAFLPCYGLAEATLIVSGHGGRTGAGGRVPEPAPVDRAALLRNEVVPAGDGPVARLTSCGPAAPGQRIAIVDPASATPCAPDRVGEIWVSGPSVAAGYWRRPGETAHVFGARMAPDGAGPFLRTGDLGFLSGGSLVVTGRRSDLIIVRGRNHYPQDIELTAERADSALRPGGSAAFLVAEEDDHLVLVHEVRHGSPAADPGDLAASIRHAVAAEHGLEVYTVVLVRPGGLPKTSSGKVQRRLCRARYAAGELPEVARDEALAGPAGHDRLAAAQVRAAQPELRPALVERYLRGEITAVCGTEPRDRFQPLLALGLDSLGAVQLTHRVHADLSVAVSLGMVHGGASLADLVDHVAVQLEAPAPTLPAAVGIPAGAPVNDGAAAPMSSAQRWMWFLQSLEPDNPAYTIAVALRLLAPIGRTALRRALDTLVSRHAALRTTFQARDGSPEQLIAPTGLAAYREFDAGWLDDAAMDRVLIRAARAPFDMASGPLFRVNLYRRGDGDVLLVSVHHIIADFWSLTVIARELGELYEAYVDGREPALPAPRATLAGAVAWQQSVLDDPGRGPELAAYWARQVDGGLPRLTLPPMTGSNGTYTGWRRFALPPDLAEGLRGRAAAAGVTPFVLLLAAFQGVLHGYTGQDDLVVGTNVSGRSRPEFAEVVGCFTQPVIIRSHRVAGEPFRAFLSRTHEKIVGALDHQDYPMMMLGARREVARRGPLFDVLFTYNRSPRRGEDLAALAAIGPAGVRRTLGSLQLESMALPPAPGMPRLELVMAEVGEEPHGLLRYHADALDDDAASDVLARFFVLLERVVAADLDQLVEQLVAVRLA